MAKLDKKIIGLVTDFGAKGHHYVASMKGVILKINPEVDIIDISHNITPFSIIETSYIVKTTHKYYPEDTVFIVVVDPGVGSSREIVAIKTINNQFFVGPNNGIFSNVFSPDDIDECVTVENHNYFLKPISKIFHGRDIMAPVGAYITKNVPLNNFGPSFNPLKFVKYPLKYEISPKNKKITCVIQYIDTFGNLTTNMSLQENRILGTSIVLEHGKEIVMLYKNQEYRGKFTSHFESVPPKSILFVKGSSGYLEVSINLGNAAKEIRIELGDEISFSF